MKLGRGVTLAGLELGLLTIQKGQLPFLTAATVPCPPFIPPHAVVLYEVHVLDFLVSGQVDDFIAMSPEEQNTVPLTTFLEVVNRVHSFGNRCFKQSRYDNARDRYKEVKKKNPSHFIISFFYSMVENKMPCFLD